MSRNVESRFALAPSVGIQRSTFNINNSLKTSFNVGEIVPFFCYEALPGDTFDIRTSKVVRLQTLLTPMMDNIYLDIYYFFVPNRLVWEHWQQFMGENTESAWLPETEYEVPQVVAPSGGWNVGTLADYFGIPTGVSNISVSALVFRAYAKIMQDWFRDENLSDPLLIPEGDAQATGSNGSNYITDVALGGKPFIASKYHDYFTSALPAPQKGPDVTIPLGTVSPVYARAEDIDLAFLSGTPLKFGQAATGNVLSGPYDVNLTNGSLTLTQGSSMPVGDGQAPLNLWTDLSQASSASINQLREAFQVQKFYEKNARGGSRYIEIIKSHFGVSSPDARLQRSEYLGGNRIPLVVNQVIQNSATSSGQTPQGNVSGMSLTSDKHYDFKRSFTEHGYVIGVCVCRYDHTYQQGIPRHFSRKNMFDYYFPVFANLGEQAIFNKEIYAQGSSAVNPSSGKAYDDEVFGYQEAWADYRFKPSMVTGEMRSAYAASLDSWHLGDDYASMPYLSDAWIREDKSNVDRVLAVTSAVSNQVFADFYIQNRATRPMPMFSIPGLMDHH